MLLTIFFVQLAGLISPGPDFFYVVKQSASHSTERGVLAAAGIAIGILVWASFAVFGLTWLTQNFGLLFQHLFMLIGGSYLGYIGYKMIRVTQNATIEQIQQERGELNYAKELKNGILINLFNAKVGVFFSSVLAGYLTNLTDIFIMLEVILIIVVSTFVYFSLVAVLFSRKAIQQFYSQHSRYLDNGAGLIFIGFGLKLIYEGVKYFM